MSRTGPGGKVTGDFDPVPWRPAEVLLLSIFFARGEDAMQTVRFFEDHGNPGGARRLLVGVAICEESWAVDGGRREAVNVATTEDAERYPAAFAEYYNSFAQTEEGPADPAASPTPHPGC